MHPHQCDALVGETQQIPEGGSIGLRQAQEGHEIPEQQLEQQGNLADEADVEGGQLAE